MSYVNHPPNYPVATLPFTDTFTRADEWPQPPYYTPQGFGFPLAVKGGALREIVATSSDRTMFLTIDKDDFTFTFDVTMAASGSPSNMLVFFRCRDDRSWPALILAVQASAVWQIVNVDPTGAPSVLVNGTHGLSYGATQTLQLSVHGTTCTFAVNGVPDMTVTIPALPGQRTFEFVMNNDCAFDNFNIVSGVPHTETFNAADNYPTGPIVTDGITWTTGGGAANYGRSGGTLIFEGHDSDLINTAAVVTLECGSGDGTVSATGVRNTTVSYGTGLAWRQSAPGTFWFIETSASSTHGQGAVRRAVSGHTTGTTYLTIGTLPDNATLSVVLAGPLMTFYVNGTNVGTVTDSTDATATKHGAASDRGGGFGSVDSFTYA